jgi:hypothetical protein
MQNQTTHQITTTTEDVKEPTKLELAVEKLQALLTSRKFWSLIWSLVTIWTAFANHAIDGPTAVWSTVGAFGAYSVSTGIEDASKWNSFSMPTIISGLVDVPPPPPPSK